MLYLQFIHDQTIKVEVKEQWNISGDSRHFNKTAK